MILQNPTGQCQILLTADLLDGPASAFLSLITGPVAVVYSDPPWNPGNEKTWRRAAGVSEPVSYNHLLDAWCLAAARCHPLHIFCEQSVNDAHRQLLFDAIARCGEWSLPLLEQWTVFYGSPGSRGCQRPNILLHFGHTPITTDPSGMRGEAMTACVFDGLTLPAGATVADPCIGKGMTSRQAYRRGLNCIGAELNPDRLAKTVDWLLKHGYTVHPPAIDDDPLSPDSVLRSIQLARALPPAERVALYNRIQSALGELISDIAPDPACAPQLLPAASIAPNAYNPNFVASTELDLLERSMIADGITMPAVVMAEGSGWEVIDGFHRRKVAIERLGRDYLPCSVLSRPLADRMASTVRHNRARGKHQVELMGSLVREMIGLGWEDTRIAAALGMTMEEYSRLCSVVGAAPLLAASEYSLSWGPIEENHENPPDA